MEKVIDSHGISKAQEYEQGKKVRLSVMCFSRVIYFWQYSLQQQRVNNKDQKLAKASASVRQLPAAVLLCRC